MRDNGDGGAQMPVPVGQGDRPVLLGGKWTEGAERKSRQNQEATLKLSVYTEAGVAARKYSTRLACVRL